MRYTYWIIEGLLAGRPGPVAQPWSPEELYAGGIRAIVSLPEEEPVADLSAYGFIHYHGRFPPVMLFSRGMRKAFIHQSLPVLDFIHQQITSGNPTLIHCHAGKDRTGVILAGYLITYHHISPAEALERVRAAQPDSMTAEGYAEALELLTPGVLPDPRTLL